LDTEEKKVQSEKEVDQEEISPQVLKELDHYNSIIDSTIEKIQNIFLKYHNTITPEKKKELE
jgi:predicted glycosyltransferase